MNYLINVFKFYYSDSVFVMLLFLPSDPQSWVLIEQDHFLDNGVVVSVEVVVVLELSRAISALLGDPLLFAWLKVSFKVSVVLAYNSFGRIVEPITDIVSAIWDLLWSFDVVTDQCLAVWSQTLSRLLCIETSILYRAIVPFFVFKLEVIIEKVFTL